MQNLITKKTLIHSVSKFEMLFVNSKVYIQTFDQRKEFHKLSTFIAFASTNKRIVPCVTFVFFKMKHQLKATCQERLIFKNNKTKVIQGKPYNLLKLKRLIQQTS